MKVTVYRWLREEPPRWLDIAIVWAVVIGLLIAAGVFYHYAAIAGAGA